MPAVIRVLTSDSLNISIATIGAPFEGKKIDHTLVGKFTQMGYSYDLSLNAGEIQVKRPQTPQPPFNYTEEEATPEKTDRSKPNQLQLIARFSLSLKLHS